MKTRMLFRVWLCATVLFGLLAQTVPNVQAQYDRGDVVSFTALGEREILLDGPIDSTTIDFYLPAHWSLTPGALVHLNMRVFIGTDTQDASADTTAGFIEVYLNDIWLETIPLNRSGEYSVDVGILDSAWVRSPEHAPQSLRIYLHDSVRCGLLWISAQGGNWRGINAAIAPTSYLVLPHQEVAVPTDLRTLPYPLYQGSFLPEQALVIVPDEPSQAEIQAALTVAAALGQMTSGDLKMEFLTPGLLSPAVLANTHAIFIGDPAGFPQLAEVEFLPADNATGPEDGLLRMAVSPLNPAMVWMTINGNSPAGLIKAAQAFGSQQVRVYGPPNLAIVTDVVRQPDAPLLADFTLADLGYDEQTFSGYGITYFAYWFDIPATYKITEGAYFELLFNNSALLNYDESGITVLLNDLFVGGVRLSDRTTDTSSTKFNIPAYMFHPGRNLLLLEINLAGITPCIPFDEIWVSVKPGSNLHTPSVPAGDGLATERSLTEFPSLMFPTFEKMVFVVSRNDPDSWALASRLANQIGIGSGGSVISPLAAFADALPADWKETNSLILIGQPTKLPIMAELAGFLPAPFEAGRDIASEPRSEFTFNVPDGVPVGYLQVMPSPWDRQQVILAINGNGTQGMQAAINILADSNLRADLRGNLAVIYGSQVLVARIESTAEPNATPVVNVTVLTTPEAPVNAESGPFQIDLVTLGVAILTGIIILAVITWVVGRRRKKA